MHILVDSDVVAFCNDGAFSFACGLAPTKQQIGSHANAPCDLSDAIAIIHGFIGAPQLLHRRPAPTDNASNGDFNLKQKYMLKASLEPPRSGQWRPIEMGAILFRGRVTAAALAW